MRRGILYMVWEGPPGLTGCGQVPYQALLERSIASVKKHLPDVPVKVIECDPKNGLLNKTLMGRLTPFKSTLFLDADTVVLGDLRWAWNQAEKHGMACCIGQCPWLRRYGQRFGDGIEYNTGVLFFTNYVESIMDMWELLGTDVGASSRFMQGDKLCGLECDDQFSFARAVAGTNFNPWVLPMNYNFQPGWQTRFFTPMKVWHSVHPVPPGLEERSLDVASGKSLVSFCEIPVPGSS